MDGHAHGTGHQPGGVAVDAPVEHLRPGDATRGKPLDAIPFALEEIPPVTGTHPASHTAAPVDLLSLLSPRRGN